MTVVGAYARVDLEDSLAVRRRLERLSGVEPFDLDDPAKLGLVIEAESVESASVTLQEVVPRVQGVLGVWPVYIRSEPPEESQA